MPPKPSEDFSTTNGDGWGQAPSSGTMGSGTFVKIVFSPTIQYGPGTFVPKNVENTPFFKLPQ